MTSEQYYAPGGLGFNTLVAVCWTSFSKPTAMDWLTRVMEKPGLLSGVILLDLLEVLTWAAAFNEPAQEGRVLEFKPMWIFVAYVANH